MNINVLVLYYEKYLKEIRGLSMSSINHYQGALRTISKYLVSKGKIQQIIYEIQDIAELEEIQKYLYVDPDFRTLNKRGNHMYSAALNNYYRFACGTDFSKMYKQMKVMDIAVPISDQRTITIEKWNRSSIIKRQSLESAGYQCEINAAHDTFIAKSTGHQYMEGHHVLPMKYQSKFKNSLDVYANIICLCPICHRLLHYGVATEKEGVIDKIYSDRVERLATSGIKISKAEFKNMVL